MMTARATMLGATYFELERRTFWIRKSAAPAILIHVVYESEHARDYFGLGPGQFCGQGSLFMGASS